MAKIKVTLPIGDVVSMGKLVTFTTPCDCSVADTIVVNGWEFKMVNAVGYTIPEIGDEVFKEGAVVSVILDTEKNQAFLQNGNESYTKKQTLTAETAALFDLPDRAVPNDVLKKLANAPVCATNPIPKYTEIKIDMSKLQVGDTVNIPYKKSMVTHRVVHIGNPNSAIYPSSFNNGMWLLPDTVDVEGPWSDNPASKYSDAWSDNAFMDVLQTLVSNYAPVVSKAILQVKIPYTEGKSEVVYKGESGYSCKLFLPSYTELTRYTVYDHRNYKEDGAVLDYFSDLVAPGADFANRRKCSSGEYWTRSDCIGVDEGVEDGIGYVNKTGGMPSGSANTSRKYRYMFLLPKNFSTTLYLDKDFNIHDKQEYSESGVFVDMLGATIGSITKLTSGTYIGTGTSGSSNKNSLRFWFKPSMVLITGNGYFGVLTSEVSDYFCAGISGWNRLGKNGIAGSVTFDTNGTVSWYASASVGDYNFRDRPNIQFNAQSVTYSYIAIG